MRPTKNKPTKAASKPHTATDKADKTKDTSKAAADALKAREAAPKAIPVDALPRGIKVKYRIKMPVGVSNYAEVDSAITPQRLPRAVLELLEWLYGNKRPGGAHPIDDLPPRLKDNWRARQRALALKLVWQGTLYTPERPDGVSVIGITHPRGTSIVDDLRCDNVRKRSPKATQDFTFDGAMAYFNGKALMLGTGIALEAFKKLVEKEGRPVPFKELYQCNRSNREAFPVLREAIRTIRRALEAVGAPYEVRNAKQYGYYLAPASARD